MPTYKFKCENCGEFKHFSPPSQLPEECPECGGEIKQIFSPPNIVFKQGAFYKKGSA